MRTYKLKMLTKNKLYCDTQVVNIGGQNRHFAIEISYSLFYRRHAMLLSSRR